MRAGQVDVAFRLLVAVGELWDGLVRAGIDPSQKGVHVTREYLGGYIRISAGPSSHPRLVAEWCESSQHFRILKRDDWNEYTIRCEGKHIQLWVNGTQTVDYIEKDEKIEDFGIIAVQIHGGPPSEAWYKDISIQELP